jgi:hypothetical protein
MPGSLDERLVGDVARRLGAGGYVYTDRQLWYAVCAELEPPELTRGLAQVVAGVVLIAVGVVFGILATVFVAVLVPIGMVIAGMGVQNRRLERNRPAARALMVSYDAFVRETVDPMRERHSNRLAGLLPADGLPEPEDAPSSLPEGVKLLVCDRGETAALLSALAPPQAPTWRAVVENDAPPFLGHARVFAIHDADPRGCALPLRLAEAGARDVTDAGLRPGQLSGHRLQIIEGAPYVVSAELSRLLTPDEVVWLAMGRRVELAILSPQQLAVALPGVMGAAPTAPPGAAPRAVKLAGASLLSEVVDEEPVPA